MALPYFRYVFRKNIHRKNKLFKIITGVSIKNFQIENKLTPDGLLGNQTIQILKRQIF